MRRDSRSSALSVIGCRGPALLHLDCMLCIDQLRVVSHLSLYRSSHPDRFTALRGTECDLCANCKELTEKNPRQSCFLFCRVKPKPPAKPVPICHVRGGCRLPCNVLLLISPSYLIWIRSSIFPFFLSSNYLVVYCSGQGKTRSLFTSAPSYYKITLHGPSAAEKTHASAAGKRTKAPSIEPLGSESLPPSRLSSGDLDLWR